MKQYRRALTIAGSDPSGGAGLQADLKTFSALGVYGTSAVVAVVDENTCGVYGVFELPEGAVCRHHEEAWIKELLKDFTEQEYRHLTFTTMNGNQSKGFYFIGKL